MANITEEGAATFSNLTVSTGKIIGSEYESMHDEANKNLSTRMKLDSGSLEFYRGDYQQDANGNYYNDVKQVELTTNSTGVSLNAVNGNAAAIGAEGKNVFYAQNGEGYINQQIHVRNLKTNKMEDGATITNGEIFNVVNGIVISAGDESYTADAEEGDANVTVDHKAGSTHFHFYIPKGEQGEQGEQGPQGPRGPAGSPATNANSAAQLQSDTNGGSILKMGDAGHNYSLYTKDGMLCFQVDSTYYKIPQSTS